MNVREYQPEDLTPLTEIHARQNLGFSMPDLSDGTFVVGAVGCDETGKAQMAAFLQITAQGYLLVNGEHGTPQERWRTLLTIHDRMEREARRLGLKDCQVWIPPQLAKGKRFQERLEGLGWVRDEWPNYTFYLR